MHPHKKHYTPLGLRSMWEELTPPPHMGLFFVGICVVLLKGLLLLTLRALSSGHDASCTAVASCLDPKTVCDYPGVVRHDRPRWPPLFCQPTYNQYTIGYCARTQFEHVAMRGHNLGWQHCHGAGHNLWRAASSLVALPPLTPVANHPRYIGSS